MYNKQVSIHIEISFRNVKRMLQGKRKIRTESKNRLQLKRCSAVLQDFILEKAILKMKK